MEPPLSVGNSNDRARDSSLHRQSAIQPGATAVSYTEPSEDDNEEEQLFIETIRRGALAVQQRRRRLLEGPPRSRPTPQLEAEEQERSDDGAGDAATGRDITSLAPAGMHPRAAPHSLLSTSLLAAHLDNLRSPSAEILRVGGDTTSRATARSDATPPMLLLYCDSLSMNLSLASLSSGLQSPASGAPAAVETTRRSAFPRSTLAPLRYSSPSSSGGCGKLVCARGFQSIKHGPNAFSSDAHPSHLLVDWLDILPGKEEESRWNDMCGCLYATLGCRNCGNAVGISKLYKCDACRCMPTDAPFSVFWTSRAMIRRPDLPLQAAWDEQTATRDVAVLSGQFGAKHYHGLPSKEGDCLEGLAGDALEWDQRSECKLNTTISHPLRDYQKEIKVGSMASVHDMLLSTGTRDNNSRESEILERAQALRRDLRAFIARTSVLDNHIDTTSGVSNTNGRRRRSYHESRATQSALALSNGSARDEREFRRRRTAEILESGAEQLEREVSPLTVPGGLFDGPVAR